MKTTTATTKLQRAVIRQLGGRESLQDIANHGIAGGFDGFIYYTDTVAFFKRNRKEITEKVVEMAHDLGEEPIKMVAMFNCLGGGRRNGKEENTMSEYGESVARCLYGGRLTNEDTTVANALAWFAAEETARELTDN